MIRIAQSTDELIASLYRAARELPAEQFQEHALLLIKPWLQFASGIWGFGQLHDGYALQVHAAHLHQVAPDSLIEWQQINRADKVIPEQVKSPGRTRAYHAPTLFGDDDDAVMRDYARRWGRQSYLATVTSRIDWTRISWISLYRPDPDHHFSDAERSLCQLLMCHLSEALAVNQAIHLHKAHPADGNREQFMAVADRSGNLYHADARFLALLQSEWPQADDRCLPAPLSQALTRDKRSSFVGNAISCDGLLVAGLLLIRARPKAPVDALTPRRSLIARYFAEGHNHKEIARRAQIAPATVRNHLRAIYEILGVRTRSELTTLMRGGSARQAAG